MQLLFLEILYRMPYSYYRLASGLLKLIHYSRINSAFTPQFWHCISPCSLSPTLWPLSLSRRNRGDVLMLEAFFAGRSKSSDVASLHVARQDGNLPGRSLVRVITIHLWPVIMIPPGIQGVVQVTRPSGWCCRGEFILCGKVSPLRYQKSPCLCLPHKRVVNVLASGFERRGI
jgi:hypothetical protein